jgi:heme-degrading monooxygenase HmoA
MIFVLFEVTIKKNFIDVYLAMAANLKDEISKAKGFIRSERFSSLVNERKLLSLSVWENEEAVIEWYNNQEHRKAKQEGRNSVFENYTITVTSLLRSYTDKDKRKV